MNKKTRTWSGDWLIPKTIRLPGCRVEVRFKTHKEMVEDGTRHGVWIYDHGEDFARIYLSKGDPIEVQRYTLIHELQHALVEILDVMLENYPDGVQTLAMSQVRWINESPREKSAGENRSSSGEAGADIHSEDRPEEAPGGDRGCEG